MIAIQARFRCELLIHFYGRDGDTDHQENLSHRGTAFLEIYNTAAMITNRVNMEDTLGISVEHSNVDTTPISHLQDR